MSELDAPTAMRPEEAVVRDYLTALNSGHVVDVLNAFSMDARLRDSAGRERHGIREIAEAFAGRERHVKVDLEDVRREGDAVSVRVRLTYSEDRPSRDFQGVFRVRHNRIESLAIDPLPATARRKRRLVTPS